jgi:hypothetical protein
MWVRWPFFYGKTKGGLNISALSGNDLLFRYAMYPPGVGGGLTDMRWGMSLAAGDFNRDGYADLAIGAPMDDVGSITDAGSVSVLYGSASDFWPTGNQLFTQNTSGVSDDAEAYDWFGHTLIAGDFNGDGVPDLGVGVPFEDLSGKKDGGALNLLFGSPGVGGMVGGISTVDSTLLFRGGGGLKDSVEVGDQFGGSLYPKLFKNPWPTVPAAPRQQPYGGTPWALPGLVQAEDYDVGGEGVAYHDATAGNAGGQYRSDRVDIWRSPSEGYYVGNNATGEWLEYTVEVATAGAYRVALRVATAKSGRQLRLALDGVNVTGLITLPNTRGWQRWQTVRDIPLTLPAGRHVLRVTVARGGLNFGWFEVTTGDRR